MKSLTAGTKIALTVAIPLGFILLLGVVALENLGRLSDQTTFIVSDPLPGLYQMGAVQSAIATQSMNALLHIASTDPQEMRQFEESYAAAGRKYEETMVAYSKTITTNEDRDLYNRIPPAYERMQKSWADVIPLSREGKNAEALALFRRDTMPAIEEAMKAIHNGVEKNRAEGERGAVEAGNDATAARMWIWTMLLSAFGVAGTVAFFVVRGLNRNLRSVVSELGAGADQVASAAGQVSSSSQSLAQGSSEQAASLEETSASTEELTSMVKKNADSADSAARMMDEAAVVVAQATSAVEEMAKSMTDINGASEKVSKIIKVIDEIAFQTNILALNAAVEAARAGEAGMGFAVVADEVRNLAQRCAQAAKDTAALIQESIARAGEGKQKLDVLTRAMSETAASAGKVKTIVTDVNMGSREQARGIEHIASAVTQMERVTQTTAASAEQSASASEELTSQAEGLRAQVARLAALVGAVADRAPAASARRMARKPEVRSELKALGAALGKATVPATVPAKVVVHPDRRELPLDDKDFVEF